MQTEQEQKAKEISVHIIKRNPKIDNLNQEQLASLVNNEFDNYGLNYIIVKPENMFTL